MRLLNPSRSGPILTNSTSESTVSTNLTPPELPPELPAPPPAIGPDGIHLAAPDNPPAQPPAPCPECGCVFWWEDAGDVDGANLHCCECQRIPSRRMAAGSWAVVLEIEPPQFEGQGIAVRSRPAWREYTPQRWSPFAHLDAAAAAAARPAERSTEAF